MPIIRRPIIEIDEELCDGCGQCVPACEEGAIQIINGKAQLIAEKMCDGLGACLGHCPRGAIKIVEREAEAFDEAAVKAHTQETLACGCPGTMLRELNPRPVPQDTHIPSALSHWPVQIRLVPPEAPFLKGARLLVAADCATVAYPELHQKLLPGRKILMGCPKFDPLGEYEARFEEIFKQARPKEVTVLLMTVPCCQGLLGMLKSARAKAGVQVAFQVLTVDLEGKLVKEEIL